MRALLLAVLCLIVSPAYAAVTEVDAQLIDGRMDLPGLSLSQQVVLLKALHSNGASSGPFLSAFYIHSDSPELAWANPAFLQKLYRMNDTGSEANCYWTSMFALGVVSLPERYMDLDEYLSLVGSRFAEVDKSQDRLPGDVLRLRRARGAMDVHSVVYIGRLRGSDAELVFSKNGTRDGPYLIMDLWDLENRVYPSSFVNAVYRLKP